MTNRPTSATAPTIPPQAGASSVARAAAPSIPAGDVHLVPLGMRIAAAWGWRIVVVVLAFLPIAWVVSKASIVVIPLLVAALFAALLKPLYDRLRRMGWPTWLALITTLLALMAAVSGLLALVVTQMSHGLRLDPQKMEHQYRSLLQLLQDSPFHVTEGQFDEAVQGVSNWVRGNLNEIAGKAAAAGSFVMEFLAGSIVMLFALIFYLLDGRRIWLFIVGLFPREARAAIDGAGQRGWVSVGHYARVQVIVALMDAVGITAGALLLHVPFAIPIGIIVFLAAFVPYLGAITSGGLAVLVALIYNDPLNALLMLVVVVAVMQIEAHIFQPLIMGNAVQVHPLAVLVAVSAGSIFAGIPGAIFAVPLVAALKEAVGYIASGQWRSAPDPTRSASASKPDAGGEGTVPENNDESHAGNVREHDERRAGNVRENDERRAGDTEATEPTSDRVIAAPEESRA